MLLDGCLLFSLYRYASHYEADGKAWREGEGHQATNEIGQNSRPQS